jgi:hypothetical protein
MRSSGSMSTTERIPKRRRRTQVSHHEVASQLQGFPGRGAGTDAERRAGEWLAMELLRRLRGRAQRRDVGIETFWSRPNRALAQGSHAALALAGSLVSVASPRTGGAMLLAALVFVVADALTGISPGRWIAREHASQNVVAVPTRDDDPASPNSLHLVITANYDTGQAGLAYRDPLRGAAARVRQALRGKTLGWQGWLAVAILWALVTAILRLRGHDSTIIGLAQLLPTFALLVAIALLGELAVADWSPGAGDNGSGVGVALALARALAYSPPRHMNVEVVLTGAGDGEGIGLRRYLRVRRTTHRAGNTVVLGISPCAAGDLRWWRTDGSLFPLRYGSRLLSLAQQVAEENPQFRAAPYAGRGTTPAFPARQARVPGLTIGCLDERGLVPRSHQATDVADALDQGAHDRAVQFGLMLVDAIDAVLAARREPPPDAREPPPDPPEAS